MRFEDLRKIEETLKITLPIHYKDFQIHYPDKLRELNFNESFFSEDPDYLIQINQFWRNGDFPSELFSIGSDIGGNFYFIKLDDSEHTVLYFDHEDASSEESEFLNNWYDILRPNYNNLIEFSDWLVNFWDDAIF